MNLSPWIKKTSIVIFLISCFSMSTLCIDADAIPQKKLGLPQSCKERLEWFPESRSGTYKVAPFGGQSFTVYCDMDFKGWYARRYRYREEWKGWTLVMTQQPGVRGLPGNPDHRNTHKSLYLALERVKRLAAISSQIHIRTRNDAENKSVESYPGSQPIINLRKGVVLNAESSYAAWMGPMSSRQTMDNRRPDPRWVWAQVFHGPPNGLHLSFTGNSTWRYLTEGRPSLHERMEVYLR